MKTRIITSVVGLCFLALVLSMFNTIVLDLVVAALCLLGIHEAFAAFGFKTGQLYLYAPFVPFTILVMLSHGSAARAALLPAAFSMAMLGAIESLLCAVVLDGMTGTKHKANSELIGQGLGNIVAPFFGGITATAAIARSAANVRAGATSPISAVIHALLVIMALLILAPLLSWLPLSAMAALLLMVAWNMSEAHKVVNLLRYAPKDDIIVMLMCMSLTVLFDMVIAISVGIVLASLLFMRRIARMTRLAPVNVEVPDDVLVLRVIGPLFFAAAEGLFTDLETRVEGKRIVVLKWDAVPVLDAGGLDAFQRFVNKLPEGCELRVSNLEFQPLRTLARAGVKPIPGRLSFYPDRNAALADI